MIDHIAKKHGISLYAPTVPQMRVVYARLIVALRGMGNQNDPYYWYYVQLVLLEPYLLDTLYQLLENYND